MWVGERVRCLAKLKVKQEEEEDGEEEVINSENGGHCMRKRKGHWEVNLLFWTRRVHGKTMWQ